MGEIPNDVKLSVRSVLLSKVGGILVSQFRKDYKSLVQKPIQYVNYGYENLEDFFKAMPDVARLDYSKTDMAYRVFGISKDDMYKPTWIEKSENPLKKDDRRQRNKSKNQDDKLSDSSSVGKGSDKDLKPDSNNRYSVVYPRSLTPHYTVEDVKKRFANTGSVCNVHMVEKWIFVRYRKKADAIRAHDMYKDVLDVRHARPKNDNDKNSSSKNKSSQEKSCEASSAEDFSKENEFVSKSAGVFGSKQKHSSKSSTKSSIKEVKGVDISKYRVYFGNLDTAVTEEDLSEIIEGKPVTDVCVKRFNEGAKVVGFVTFTCEEHAESAVQRWNGTIWHGRDLLVQHANGKLKMNTSNDSLSSNISNLEISPRNRKDSNNSHVKTFKPKKDLPTTTTRLPPSASPEDKKTNQAVRCKNGIPDLEDTMPELEEMMPELEDMEDKTRNPSHANSDEGFGDTVVFVGNFPSGMTVREFYALFRRYDVVDVEIISNTTSSCTKAFITLPTVDLAIEAILDLDQIDYMNQILKVSAPYDNPDLQQLVDSKLQEYMSDTSSSGRTNSHSSRSIRCRTSPSKAVDISDMSSEDAASLLKSFSFIQGKLPPRNTNLPKVGMKVNFSITSWLIEQFYFAQNANDVESVRELLDISIKLQNSDNHLGRTHSQGRCAALYMGQWYRAWVLERSEVKNGNVKVFYVDYGNVSVVPLSDTTIIPNKMWELSPQAYIIRLKTETSVSEKDLVDKLISTTVVGKIVVDQCQVYELNVDNIKG